MAFATSAEAPLAAAWNPVDPAQVLVWSWLITWQAPPVCTFGNNPQHCYTADQLNIASRRLLRLDITTIGKSEVQGEWNLTNPEGSLGRAGSHACSQDTCIAGSPGGGGVRSRWVALHQGLHKLQHRPQSVIDSAPDQVQN